VGLWQPLGERLAAQILADAGSTDIDPIHSRGGADGGKEAIAKRDGQRWIMAVYFPHDPRPYSKIEGKAVSDAAGVAKNGAHGMAFVTNQELTDGERKSVRKAVGSRSHHQGRPAATRLRDRKRVPNGLVRPPGRVSQAVVASACRILGRRSRGPNRLSRDERYRAARRGPVPRRRV